MSIRIFWASPQAAHLESATHSYSRLAGSCSSGSNASDPVRRGIRNRLDSADCNVQIGHALSFRKLPAYSDFANRCPFNRPPARPPACRHHRYYVCCATPIRSMPSRHEENSPRKQEAWWRGHWREEDGMGHAGFRPRDRHIDLGNDPANRAPRNLERRTNPDPRFISRPWSCSSQAARFSLLTSASATRSSCTIDRLVTRRRLFSLQGGLFRRDRVHIVSCPEIAAARSRDARPSFRRLVSVGRECQGNRDALRLHCHHAQKRTNRSVGKNTSRHSLAFRHQFSPHLQGIQRPRRIERHDVCGSRGNDTGPPGMGVPKPQFGHCRKHNRP